MPDQFQYVKLPDGSYGKFAADAGDDVIKAAIAKDFPNAFQQQPSMRDKILNLARATNTPAGGANYPTPEPGFANMLATTDNPILKQVGNAIANEQNIGNSIKSTLSGPGAGPGLKGNMPKFSDQGPLDVVRGMIGNNPGEFISNLANFALMKKGTDAVLGPRPSIAQNTAPTKTGFSTAVNRLTNAVGPNGEPLGKTTPELLERNLGTLQDANPPAGPNTVRQPAILDRINTALGTIENKFKTVLNTPTPGGGTVGDSVRITGDRIAQAIEQKITPALEKAEPDVAAALREEAANYRRYPAGTNNVNIAGPNGQLQGPVKEFSLNELNEIRQMKNAQNDAFHKGDQLQQFTASKNPQATKIANRIIESAARDELYKEMGNQNLGLTETDIRSMKQSQGDILNVKQQLQDRLANLLEQGASSQGSRVFNKIRGSVHPYASPHGFGVHASSLLNLIEPQAVTDLKAIQGAEQVFQPRSNPFSAPTAFALQNLLLNKKR